MIVPNIVIFIATRNHPRNFLSGGHYKHIYICCPSLSSCALLYFWPYLRKGNISSHAAIESVPTNSGAVLDQFYPSRNPSPGGHISYHVARPLQQDKWTQGKYGFLRLFCDPAVV